MAWRVGLRDNVRLRLVSRGDVPSLVYDCAFDARSFVALWHGLRMLSQSPLATRDACAPPRACRVACLGRVSCSECHLCVLPPLIGAVRVCR